jgi:tetratricopeptide (TPR) repeat protein
VLVICGPTMIDGYAFCLGVDSLRGFYEARIDLQSMIRSVTYLIRGAIFRPNYRVSGSGRVSQDICSLGELIDMYHTHEATQRHDKVYALLGMSSDDASKANLLPDYSVPWEEIFQRLIKFLVCEKISVETWGDKETAVIKSKGCILGKVSSVQNDITWNGGQGVNVILNNMSKEPGSRGEWSAHWTLLSSAKSIQDEDLICLLQGASKPTIIRLCKDYFAIIMIAATPLESTQTGSEDIKWQKLFQSTKVFTRDFLLVWDWKNSLEKLQDLGKYENLIQPNNRVSEHAMTELEGQLDNATRLWNVALILEDAEEHETAQESFQEAIEGYEKAIGEEHPHTLKSQNSQTPLSWAAQNGHEAVIELLLAKDGVDPDLKESQSGLTPLWWAAEKGHEAAVKLLLETGKVKVDSEDKDGRTPLWWAARNGHEAVVMLLLETGKAEVDSKDKDDQTPLWWAARNGHEAVVMLLLETGKAEVDSKDKDDQTPLWSDFPIGRFERTQSFLWVLPRNIELSRWIPRFHLVFGYFSGNQG